MASELENQQNRLLKEYCSAMDVVVKNCRRFGKDPVIFPEKRRDVILVTLGSPDVFETIRAPIEGTVGLLRKRRKEIGYIEIPKSESPNFVKLVAKRIVKRSVCAWCKNGSLEPQLAKQLLIAHLGL